MVFLRVEIEFSNPGFTTLTHTTHQPLALNPGGKANVLIKQVSLLHIKNEYF